MAAAEDVDVQMLHSLAAIGADVGDEAETGGAALVAEAGGDLKDVAEGGGIGGDGVFEGGARDHEEMHRSFGGDIEKGDAEVVFVDDFGGYFTAKNLAKNRFGHSSPRRRAAGLWSGRLLTEPHRFS